MATKNIDPNILQQLHNLDNPGPNALRPSQAQKTNSRAPKKQSDYSSKYGLENKDYSKNKQQIYTPALSLSDHQAVSNQAYQDSARQTALDYSYARKTSKLNQDLNQQNFEFENKVTGFENRRNASLNNQYQRSLGAMQGSQNQQTLRTQGRNDRNLARIQNSGASNQTALQVGAQRDMNLATLAAQQASGDADRAATLATAKLQSDTQRAISSESNRYNLASNVLSASRAGYRYW